MVNISAFIQTLIPFAVLALNIFLLYMAFLLLYKGDGPSNVFKDTREWLGANATKFAFIVSLTAMLGSLFYSDVLGYTPCLLCWYQRIAMYPLVFIFGVDVFTESDNAFRYAVPLIIIGTIIAGYHYGLHQWDNLGIAASCGEGQVPCTDNYTFHFGYMTIPMMALTGFLGTLALYGFKRKYS